MANSPEKEKAAAAATVERKKVRTTPLSGKAPSDRRAAMISSCGNNSHIPSEIVLENILTRLPVKSLNRFRCVCKLWYSTIVHDRGFHQSHLALSPSRPCLLAFVGKKHKDPHSPSMFCCTSIPSSESNSASFCNLSISGKYQVTEVVNGLLCLYSSESDINLYNLSTHEKLNLKLPLSISIVAPLYRPAYFVLYLGFDHLDKVYKLVKLVINRECQIITLGKDNQCWRRIICPFSCSIAFAKSVCCNSSMFWISKESLILCDLNEEKFTKICYPDDFTYRANIPDYGPFNDSVEAGIAEIGGRSALTHSYIGARRFVIWMLDDKQWTWGKQIVIEIPIHLHNPSIFFTIPAGRLPAGTNEILFTIGRSLSSTGLYKPNAGLYIPIYYSYDLASKTWKRLYCSTMDSAAAAASSSPLSNMEVAYKDYSQLYFYHEENILPLKDILTGS